MEEKKNYNEEEFNFDEYVEDDDDYFDNVDTAEMGHGLKINDEDYIEEKPSRRERRKARRAQKEKKTKGKIIRRVIAWILLIVLALALGGFIYLCIHEYKPSQNEKLNIVGTSSDTLSRDEKFSIMTWNIGYCGLGDEADFFMEGGDDVTTYDKAGVSANLKAITQEIIDLDPDIALLQEVDQDSTRSYHINELQYLGKNLSDYQYAFANNFKCEFVPYPIPPIGKVDSGISTFSKYEITSAKRTQLPIPFSWPVSVFNLKRCLLITRIPLDDTDRELVVVNLHLEAYDDGEGKKEQTQRLKRILEDEVTSGNYVIAAGDFNQVFSNVDNSMYMDLPDTWKPGTLEVDEFGYGLTAVMDNSVPTCRGINQPYKGNEDGDFQFYMVDGYILSSNIKVVSLETVDTQFQWSDHNPVLLTCKLES